MDNRPIGFFDSGLGGLTCIPGVTEELPEERILYFGDTARTPYGSKAISTILQFTGETVDFLLSKDVKLIVIACNTVSSTAMNFLRESFPQVHFIGVIDPMINMIRKSLDNTARIGVIGTKVTIESGVYQEKTEAALTGAAVFAKACPLFVPLIEEGFTDHEMIDLAIHYYLDDFVRDNGLTHIVLGCTHYPMIEHRIRAIYPRLEILNPSLTVADAVVAYLTEHDMLADRREGENLFYASDLSDNFKRMTEQLLGDAPGKMRLFNLENPELR